MLIRPHTLSLITTYRCTAACDHCCFGCTPQVPTSRAIPFTRMLSLIDEAADLGSIRVVVFTGGECFLLGARLNRLIALASAHDLVTRCVTNGYWALSRESAERRIDALVKAGLQEINFSTGSCHAKYVPVERVVHGSVAAAAAGLTTLVTAEIFRESGFDVDSLVSDPDFGELLDRGRLRLQRNVWLENDWGNQKISHPTEFSRFQPSNATACTTLLNVLAVTPTQDLVACCGLTQELIPELSLGSIAARPLADVLAAAPDDLLKIWIHLEGPERVLLFVKDQVSEYELPVSSVHPCQTCLHLYNDETAKRVIREHYSEMENRLATLYMGEIATSKLSSVVDETDRNSCGH